MSTSTSTQPKTSAALFGVPRPGDPTTTATRPPVKIPESGTPAEIANKLADEFWPPDPVAENAYFAQLQANIERTIANAKKEPGNPFNATLAVIERIGFSVAEQVKLQGGDPSTISPKVVQYLGNFAPGSGNLSLQQVCENHASVLAGKLAEVKRKIDLMLYDPAYFHHAIQMREKNIATLTDLIREYQQLNARYDRLKAGGLVEHIDDILVQAFARRATAAATTPLQ